MKRLYTLLLFLLYSAAAIYIGDIALSQMLFTYERSLSGVVFLTISSGIVLNVHYFMLFRGIKRKQISAILVIMLCVVDFFAFGAGLTVVSFALLGIGPIHFLKSVLVPDAFSVSYWLIAAFVLVRIMSTVYFFKKAHARR